MNATNVAVVETTSRAGATRSRPALQEVRRALVVDDDEDMRRVVQLTLLAEGTECATAASAAEALAYLRAREQDERADGGVGLILVDIVMPGMDGLELTRRIRAEDERPAIVVVTGAADLASAREATRLGADEYVVKPFSAFQLRLACEQALERRRLAGERRRAERARQELVDIVFHDLRNPLSVARGYLSLMQAMPEAATPRDVAAAAEGCAVASNMIEEIEDLGRIERSETAPKPEELHLGGIALDVVGTWRPLAERAGKRIRMVPSGDLPPVRVDSRLVRRIASDLLAGAVKHASGKSPIVVELSVVPDDSEVRLSVADDGLAVPPEMREAVFDKLRQGELRRASVRRGQGLALPFAREACRRMGGRIWVEDAAPPVPGAAFAKSGCRFVVAFPVALKPDDRLTPCMGASLCQDRPLGREDVSITSEDVTARTASVVSRKGA